MRIQIKPIIVDDVECHEAEVSCAVTASAAVRFTPVSADGTPYPEADLSLIVPADSTHEADVAFITAVRAAVQALAVAKDV